MKNIKNLVTLMLFIILLSSCTISLPNMNSNNNNDYLQSTDTVTVTMNNYYYCFKTKTYETGIIFTPKTDVEVTSYAPLLHTLANKGYLVFLLKSNDNIFDSVTSVFKGYGSVNNWYIGGHHTGGTKAADYLENNVDKFKGLFLLASYSNVDFSNDNIKILSVLAENDQILNKDLYEGKKANLGDNLIEYTIQGGNHTYFGNYDLETGDGKATITQTKQTSMTIEYIISLINSPEVSTPNDNNGNQNPDDYENIKLEVTPPQTPLGPTPYEANVADSNGIIISELRKGNETDDAIISHNGTTITYGQKNATVSPKYIISVENYNGRFATVELTFSLDKRMTIGFEIDGYPITNNFYDPGTYTISTTLKDNPQIPSVSDNFEITFCLDNNQESAEVKSFTLNLIEFKNPISQESDINLDGLVIDNNVIVGNVQLGDGNVEINAALSGSTVTYGPKDTNWPTIIIPIANFNSSSTKIKINFTVDKTTKLGFELGGQFDWGIDHKEFLPGTYSQYIELIDNGSIDAAQLGKNFDIALYLDGGVAFEGIKNITINYVSIYKTEDISDEPTFGDTVITYEENVESFANPDIGFYKGIYIQQKHYTKEDFADYFASSYANYLFPNSLLHYRVDISEFSGKYDGQVDAPLSEQFLSALNDALRIADEAGACVIIRFCYDKNHEGFDNFDTGDKEPEMNMILQHIRQFTTVLKKYKHCITSVECGIVGPWGEMHTSSLDNPQDLKTILDQFLACIDNDMILTVRRPEHIYQYYGYTLKDLKNDINCFDYENNRLGNYNDGYLGSSSDTGTYKDRAVEVAFLEKVNATRPFGGEVITVDSEYNQLKWACGEMFQLNLSYLNIDWDDKVVKRWQNTAYKLSDPLYNGLTEFDYINNHMGYRFVCERLEYSITDTFKFKLQMKNVGFGELFKQKKGYVILTNGYTQYKFEFDYNNELTIEKSIDISNVTPGNYEFYFVLASKFTTHSIRGIRFANTNMYNDELMANKMANITIR